MDKFAQKRSLLNKLHEMANVPARSAENFFKPELKRVMNTLIDADDVIRSTLAGTKIGKASPEDSISAKDLLKEAKSFINRREYLSAVSNLGRFHKKMQDVTNVIDGLKLNVDSLHHQFLFNKLPSKHYQQLEDLEKRFASQRLVPITKEAGIIDFFHNIGTQRGRALAAWEKRYPKVVAKIREGSVSQLEAAQDVLNTALSLLKSMAANRAARNIDAYLDSGQQLSAAFKKYDSGKNGFRNFYNEVIKPYMEAQRKLNEQQDTTSSSAKAVENMMMEQGKQGLEGGEGDAERPSIPSLPAQPPGVGAPPEQFGHISIPTPAPSSGTAPTLLPAPPRPATIPTSSLPVPTPQPTPVSGTVDTPFRSDEVAEELFGPTKSSYQNFINSLKVFSNEEPALLAAHISKYARSIQVEQPDAAIQLFKIAKSLRG